jgi:hypothetical protein
MLKATDPPEDGLAPFSNQLPGDQRCPNGLVPAKFPGSALANFAGKTIINEG